MPTTLLQATRELGGAMPADDMFAPPPIQTARVGGPLQERRIRRRWEDEQRQDMERMVQDRELVSRVDEQNLRARERGIAAGRMESAQAQLPGAMAALDRLDPAAEGYRGAVADLAGQFPAAFDTPEVRTRIGLTEGAAREAEFAREKQYRERQQEKMADLRTAAEREAEARSYVRGLIQNHSPDIMDFYREVEEDVLADTGDPEMARDMAMAETNRRLRTMEYEATGVMLGMSDEFLEGYKDDDGMLDFMGWAKAQRDYMEASGLMMGPGGRLVPAPGTEPEPEPEMTDADVNRRLQTLRAMRDDDSALRGMSPEEIESREESINKEIRQLEGHFLRAGDPPTRPDGTNPAADNYFDGGSEEPQERPATTGGRLTADQIDLLRRGVPHDQLPR